MGATHGILGALTAFGDRGTLPDAERGTYFAELLTMGWFELLCCPMAMCTSVLVFEPLQRSGGKPVYKVKARLSYSEHVPRFQVNVVAEDGALTNWVVGNMEKQETHLRTKPGEFVRVQVWKLMTNSLEMSDKSSCLFGRRAFPSPDDMKIMHMAITTQAKLDLHEPVPGAGAGPLDSEDLSAQPDLSSERWVQTVTVDDPAYSLHATTCRSDRPDGPQKRLSDIDVLRIRHRGKKVAIARKQRFAGAWGLAEQPYLGVQIRPPDEDAPTNHCEGVFLNTTSLMLLLMCLAWSEETMRNEQDMTPTFAQAMRLTPGSLGSANQLGLSVAWDLDDVKQRISQRSFAKVFDWTGANSSHAPVAGSRRVAEPAEQAEHEILLTGGTGARSTDSIIPASEEPGEEPGEGS